MTKQKGETFDKRVEFKDADDDRQIATGVVMVPGKVDLQGDFERPETIRSLSEGFMGRLSSGDSEGGVMHAAFPGHSTLVENSVLDDAREIGGKEFPAGTWTQSWKFDDNELWTLVRDDILSGYSIGAEQVEWSEPMAQDELPEDVEVAAGYPDDEPAWELEDAAVVEVSAVDIPAVPDAEILQTKDATEKRIADYLGDREGFLEEMAERGHSVGEGERLWNYLQRAVDDEDVEASEGWMARAKAFFTKGQGATSAVKAEGDFEADIFRVVAPEDEAESYEDEVLGIGVDFPNSDVYVDWRNEVFPDELDEPHVSIYGTTSDLEQATGNTIEQMDTLNAKAAKALFPGSADSKDSSKSDDAAETGGTDEGGEKAAGDSMTDNEDDTAPEWAKNLQDSIDENTKRIEEHLEGGEEKSEGGDNGGEKDAFDDAPEWAKSLKESTEENAERIDDVAKASGASQQIDAGAGTEQATRKTSKAWDDTLGLPTGGDA